MEPERIYHFATPEEELNKAVEDLNNAIDEIHSEFPGFIPLRARPDMPLTDTHRLHYYFEKLRGSIQNPAEPFRLASGRVKNAICRFNVEIHRLESLVRAEKSRNPRVVCTFTDHLREPLRDEDFDNFTLVRRFGEVFINYCEVGRHLLEIYESEDEVVTDGNIRPQRHYSPDFFVWLSENERDEARAKSLENQIYDWFTKSYRVHLGIQPGNKKNALGYIPVADLILPAALEDRRKWCENVFRCNTQIRVEIHG